MTGFNYARPKATADRLLKRFGKTVPMVLLEPGANGGSSFDPVPGVPIPHSTVGVMVGYSTADLANERIQADDRRALVAVGNLVGLEPEDSWLLRATTNGVTKTFSIISVKPLEPGDITILWDIQCRAV